MRMLQSVPLLALAAATLLAPVAHAAATTYHITGDFTVGTTPASFVAQFTFDPASPGINDAGPFVWYPTGVSVAFTGYSVAAGVDLGESQYFQCCGNYSQLQVVFEDGESFALAPPGIFASTDVADVYLGSVSDGDFYDGTNVDPITNAAISLTAPVAAPEPASIAVLLLAGAGLTLARRRGAA